MITTKMKKTIRTWYGLNATVIVGPNFLHEAGFGTLLIPHPPLVNWLLRWGMSEHSKHTLTFIHEFGHLQSAPLFLFYALLMFFSAFNHNPVNFMNLIVVIVSAQAGWEISAEIYTFISNNNKYRKCYEGITLIPRIIFWSSTAALTLMGWTLAFL